MIKCSILLFALLNMILFRNVNNEKDSCSQFIQDSITTKKSGQLFITSKFKQIINYHDDTGLDFDFSIKLNLIRVRNGKFQQSKQELISELSFTKYVDSITEVNEDMIEFTSNWEFRAKSVLNTIHLKIVSQFTNSYEYIYSNNSFNKILAKEFLFPVTVSLGVGLNYTFEKVNYLNFSLVDIKTTLISQNYAGTNPEAKKLSSKIYYVPQVGISINSSIYKSWTREAFIWRNNSKIFAKGFTKNDININFKNRFMYEIYKWINISLENQIIYDPLFNYKLQLRNEVVVGVLFRK